MKQRILAALVSVLLPLASYSQLNYLGLQQQLTPPTGDGFYTLRPEIQVIDNFLYVPTFSGIYRKQLDVDTSVWEPYAFNGQPIRDFVKSGNRLLALTNKVQDSLLLLSEDNGSTYSDNTSAHFTTESFNRVYRIAQNRQNPNSIIVLHLAYGLSKSTDFGESWTSLNSYNGGYQERFADFHPTDSLTIHYGGETEFYSGYIQHTSDGGQSWSLAHLSDNNCVHYITAHPENPDLLLCASEGRISRSLDRGATWQEPFWVEGGRYISKILFDNSNTNIIYAAGSLNDVNNTIVVYRSIDLGLTWQIAYEESLADNGGVWDMVQYEDKLIFLTANEGIYALATSLLGMGSTSYQEFKVFPNPASNFIEFTGTKEVYCVTIYNMIGQTVMTITPAKNSQRIDITGIASGSYLVTFDLGAQQESRKIIIGAK